MEGHFKVKKKGKGFTWALIAGNGDEIAISTFDYDTVEHAEQDILAASQVMRDAVITDVEVPTHK